MDISVLLGLQDFRNGAGGFLAEFLKKMTFLGEINTILVILAVIYWCVHKELGTYLMMGWSGNRLLNGALKISFCAYRPWIRDARVIPYGDSITTATGYSFPSGHTMNAGTLFGGVAVRKGTARGLRILLFVMVALVALSRNYLGVHTPQDVLVGDKDWIVACAGIGLSVLLAVYAAVKSYPADYDELGKLIVDGSKMANDTFKGVGWVIAFLTGWILERRFVGFSTEVPLAQKLTRCAAGILGFYAVTTILVPLIKDWLAGPSGIMISSFLQMLYISFIFPWFVKRFEKTGARVNG